MPDRIPHGLTAVPRPHPGGTTGASMRVLEAAFGSPAVAVFTAAGSPRRAPGVPRRGAVSVEIPIHHYNSGGSIRRQVYCAGFLPASDHCYTRGSWLSPLPGA